MPVKAYSFGTTEDILPAESERTVLTIENIHATQYLYISDQQGMALSDGLRISPGGSFEVKRALGEEPQKAYYIVGSAAGTTARIFVDYADYPQIKVINGGIPPSPPTQPPNGGVVQPTPSCLASAVIPFTPLLNVFRHIRGYSPGTLVHSYYKIPYPSRHLWAWLR